MKTKDFRGRFKWVALSLSIITFLLAQWIAHSYLRVAANTVFFYSILVSILVSLLLIPRFEAWTSLLIIALALWIGGAKAWAGKYADSWRPDGKYDLACYRIPMLVSAPGGSGDARGYIQLRDNGGNILNEAPIEMVNLCGDVRWQEPDVVIGMTIWKLPE
jgi:hypothetical protein